MDQSFELAKMRHLEAEKESDEVKNGNEPKTAFRKVLVNNGTTPYVDIYVNGKFKVEVKRGGSKWFVVKHKWNPTILKAYGDEDVDQ